MTRYCNTRCVPGSNQHFLSWHRAPPLARAHTLHIQTSVGCRGRCAGGRRLSPPGQPAGGLPTTDQQRTGKRSRESGVFPVCASSHLSGGEKGKAKPWLVQKGDPGHGHCRQPGAPSHRGGRMETSRCEPPCGHCPCLSRRSAKTWRVIGAVRESCCGCHRVRSCPCTWRWGQEGPWAGTGVPHVLQG